VEVSAPKFGFECISGFEVTDTVQAGLTGDGIVGPNEVQLATMGAVLEGRHVVIESGTGTGKTLAYLLPVLQRLRQFPETRAVCMAPAIELAMQVSRVAQRYKSPDLSSVALVPVGNQRRASARLQKSTRLIVGTPERVLEMFSLRKLNGVTTFVLDEPEPILGSRNAEYLFEILSRPEPRVQLIFVGATFGAKSEQWIKALTGEAALRTRIVDNPLVSRIRHGCVRVRHEGEKDFVLTRFLRENHCERAIVFVNQPNLIRHLYRYLSEQGLRPVTVTQDRTKQQCKQAIADFTQSKAKVLLTTDRFAVGLDVAAVDWVLHYELPNSTQAYVHRAGRTARAGRSGTSVVFISDADRVKLKILERELGFEFDRSPPLAPTQGKAR